MDTNEHEFARDQATADLKLAPFPSRSPLPVAALPSMSLIPSAPFAGETDEQKLAQAGDPRITQIDAKKSS